MGNTTLALKCFNKFNSILVFHNKIMLSDDRIKNLNKKRIFTVKMDVLDNFKVPIVIADCITCMSRKDIENIYKINAQFFILLG